ncbi:hypothetical protein [Clostridium kluyveri]|uniref:hypothetical protein n=2 Tax=Clostridium kluyveri TaxID=1534 RepID=UPI0011D0BD1A|nr:hypothetical protein [Clostridium kluyveri]
MSKINACSNNIGHQFMLLKMLLSGKKVENMKFNIDEINKDRIEQIEADLMKEYRKGKRKDKCKIHTLLNEKYRLLKLSSS